MNTLMLVLFIVAFFHSGAKAQLLVVSEEIRPFYAYFYAKQAFFCLSVHQDLFMLVRPFYAYQRTHSFLCLSGLFMLIRGRVAPNHAYQSGKKMKSTYLETTVFSGDGLSRIEKLGLTLSQTVPFTTALLSIVALAI